MWNLGHTVSYCADPRISLNPGPVLLNVPPAMLTTSERSFDEPSYGRYYSTAHHPSKSAFPRMSSEGCWNKEKIFDEPSNYLHCPINYFNLTLQNARRKRDYLAFLQR
ncbi:hypothetical protein AVEN_262534-1 [Araneus ventricosus]|uniref:Uncharacterized protein n=1 Tax=Araneus ventricosus TaxID=182803 RepID=A0A4Y2TBD2_ARAVE|nr:hypothetical protein AVEN_262534-1 [Araneus ventricosus]